MGALAGLSFPIALTSAICGVIALAFTGYASILTSTIAASALIILIISAILDFTPFEYVVFGVLNLAIIFYGLRRNFAALRAGTERKIGQKTKNIVKVSQRTDEA